MSATLKEYEARLLDPTDVEGAYRFCQDLANHVAALYGFARIADDFAD